MIGQIFTDHPRAAGETYLEHQRFAGGVGVKLILAGLAALVHGLIPCLFVSTAGQTIDKLHDRLHGRQAPQAGGAGLVP